MFLKMFPALFLVPFNIPLLLVFHMADMDVEALPIETELVDEEFCEDKSIMTVVTKANYISYLQHMSNQTKPNVVPLTYSSLKQHAFGLVREWKLQAIESPSLAREGSAYDEVTKVLLHNHLKKYTAWKISEVNKVDILKNSSLDGRYTKLERE
ncbi:hypothetical protein ROZALSC1DRAFT_21688 [Rozella allomycis CSF55]|uniref:Uncharacterized protein n=1 Tax=Rozella allomycis (strain CSF55) TaxID=988480 RepID=A0A4P9YKI0_ROZAC|nr:hypothetical protein ROZALSC1DRAFT_21688 [Rozella allomycis CSF55]